jgi:hypothetical protein
VDPYVPRPGQILEEQNDLYSLVRSARLRNIRWVLMFLGDIKSLRNIMTYVPQPSQEAEERKVGPYVPRPDRGT